MSAETWEDVPLFGPAPVARPVKPWSGRAVQEARAFMARTLPAPCGKCGESVTADKPWVIGHIRSRATHPELTWVQSNWQVEHRGCSNKTGQAAVIEAAEARGRRAAERQAAHDAKVRELLRPAGSVAAGPGAVSSHRAPARQSPPLHSHPPDRPSFSLPASMTAREDLAWNPDYLRQFDWLREFAEVPDDASPPLLMSPVPDDAVGSYGAQAVEWIEQTQRITLRWWQRLSLTRQLEHRADGTLCWVTKIESAPRRAGKSVGLRGGALWRMAHAALFGEVQTVMHTGSDVAICREIHRGAWRWAESEDWTVSKGGGKEAIESPGGDRWLVRAQDAVYGYDVCLALVDEGWDVKPDTVSEGLEPAMLERSSPQLILTSTAHRRARSLMRTALRDAITGDDLEALLLLWAATPGSDPGDPEVWRAASPHWTEARRKMIAAKYKKALAGEADPELDDPDPMRGFASQYLNIWQINEPKTVGAPVTTADAWGELKADAPTGSPDVVAVESWFSEGVAVTSAWRRSDGTAVVSVVDHPTLDAAAAAIAAASPTRPVLVGASLAEDPAWRRHRVRVTSRTGNTRTAVAALVRALAEGALTHDGSQLLTDQVLALRISPAADGPRLRSTGRADAIKATAWAVAEAVTKTTRVVVPSRFRAS